MTWHRSRLLTGILLPAIVFCSLQSFIYTKGDPRTVTGEILDMKCYLASGAHGEGHMQCAKTCIQGGAPMGILTDDGQVYLLVADSKDSDPYDDAKKYAGQEVTLTGTVQKSNGVQAIIVSEVKPKS